VDPEKIFVGVVIIVPSQYTQTNFWFERNAWAPY
jgi:hypothetical protein